MVVNKMIKAQVVCDSVCNSKRITTLQLKMPRFINQVNYASNL